MIKKLLYIVVLSIWASASYGAVCTAGSGTDTCTVTQDGSGADYSAAAFNALSGDYSNDTFYFSGSFTTRITVTQVEGTADNPVILDGYQAGDCSPLTAECTSSALLTKGMDMGAGTHGPDYITVQDFRMTRAEGNSPTFRIYGNIAGADDAKHVDYINVKRNYVYESDGTMFYVYSAQYLTVDGNKFVHFGQNGTDATQGVNFIEADDVVVQNNIMGHDEDGTILGGSAYPSGCISANTVELHGCARHLWQYNDIFGAPNQGGLVIKEWNEFVDTVNIIARFNKIHHNGDSSSNAARGVSFGGSTDIVNYAYVYANNIYSNKISGVSSKDNGDFLYLWSNLIHNNGHHGYIIWGRGQGTPDNHWVINNTIARNGGSGKDPNQIARGGISLISNADGATGHTFKNNVLWNNRETAALSHYNQFYEAISQVPVLEHNSYYHSLGTSEFYYNGGYRTLATMQSSYSLENDSPTGEITDYGFTDPDGADNTHGTEDDNYTLTSGSGSLGADLSGTIAIVTVQGVAYTMDYDYALDPINTDWTTTPPTVAVVNRSDYRIDRGAYVYTTGTRRMFMVE